MSKEKAYKLLAIQENISNNQAKSLIDRGLVYVGFFTKIMFGFGIAFELPIFAYFLALLGMVNDRQMISFFKYAIILIFIASAMLTPPDVLTQLLMAGPLIILYGLSILIVKAVNPASEEDNYDEDEDDTEDVKST
jgi:sec-independent protein translocase protein TatC